MNILVYEEMVHDDNARAREFLNIFVIDVGRSCCDEVFVAR